LVLIYKSEMIKIQ